MSFIDPGIICYQHCGPKIFTFKLPDVCQACGKNLVSANCSTMPFRLPYPFIKASQYPCAVVLRPTTGDFLNDYSNHLNLHIGITTSSAAIVEFDRMGLRRHSVNSKAMKNQWAQSLLVEKVPEAWTEHWDDVLQLICKEPVWTPQDYHEDRHNCYTFVLRFLKQLGFGELSQIASSRTQFCEKFIVPRTTAAGKYISLYRKIRDGDKKPHKCNKN
uniref:CSON015401 protein n=1 Tax=Culicoides sonorensis TaxID=179676 RepID=A0A336MCY6_CULSO